MQICDPSERPDLVGNPYTGVCPNGSRVGTPSRWFNPSALALPPPGQFGSAGRNVLRGPAFAQFDLAVQKGPATLVEYLPPSVPGVRFNLTHVLLSNLRTENGIALAPLPMQICGNNW